MSAMSGKPLVFLSSLLGLLGLFSLHGAEARVRLCNETSHVLQVAAAYQQGVASKTEGWISVLPGACENGLEDLPDNAQVFTYAKSDAAHAGEGLVFDGSERIALNLPSRDAAIAVGAAMSRPISPPWLPAPVARRLLSPRKATMAVVGP
jgi:hypothetical protein